MKIFNEKPVHTILKTPRTQHVARATAKLVESQRWHVGLLFATARIEALRWCQACGWHSTIYARETTCGCPAPRITGRKNVYA